MGKSKTPDCQACAGSGVIDSGQRSKWTGAKFVKCPTCDGSGKA